MTNRLKNFDWLAGAFYPLAVLLMEAFWVYPWLLWLGGFSFFPRPRPPLSLATIVIVLAVAIVIVRWLVRQKWPVRAVQAGAIGGGLVVVLLALGVEYGDGYGFLSGQWFAHAGDVFGHIFSRPDTMVIALPALVYLWWRGINLGQSTSYFRGIYGSFVLGMVALIVLMVIWQAGSNAGDIAGPGPGIGLDVMAFFFFGLVSIALSHLYLMRSSMPREEAGLTSVWRWLPIMLAVIGGMVIAVFGVTGLFSAGFFTGVGQAFGAVTGFLGKIFNYVLIPFNYVFEGLFWLMRWLINLLRGAPDLQPENTANASMVNIFPETTTRELPPVFYLAVKWLVVVAIVAAVVFVLARAVSRYRARRAEEPIEEIHESLFSWRGLGDDLREILGMMGKKFRRRPALPIPVADSDDDARQLDVREIFRRLLRESARSGITRRRHETPGEYSGRLGRQLPGSREPLDRLTESYIGVRYGEKEITPVQTEQANGLWRMLRGLLRVHREGGGSNTGD